MKKIKTIIKFLVAFIVLLVTGAVTCLSALYVIVALISFILGNPIVQTLDGVALIIAAISHVILYTIVLRYAPTSIWLYRWVQMTEEYKKASQPPVSYTIMGQSHIRGH